MNKEDEIKKCLYILNRLKLHMNNLQGLNLNGLEAQLLQGAFSHWEHIKTGLHGVLLGKAAEPAEIVQEEEQKKHSRGSIRL